MKTEFKKIFYKFDAIKSSILHYSPVVMLVRIFNDKAFLFPTA